MISTSCGAPRVQHRPWPSSHPCQETPNHFRSSLWHDSIYFFEFPVMALENQSIKRTELTLLRKNRTGQQDSKRGARGSLNATLPSEAVLQLGNPQHNPLWPGTQCVHFLCVSTFQCRSAGCFSAVFLISPGLFVVLSAVMFVSFSLTHTGITH